MKDAVPANPIVLFLSCFLLPSFIYWTSGIHKDGLVFLGFALIIFNFYFGLKNKKFSAQRIILILLGLFVLLILRNYLLAIILPALTAWFIADRIKRKPLLVFSAVYLFSAIAFFSFKYVSPKLDFPAAVVSKQQSFLNLQGRS
jgi:hypothetical protein